MSKEKFIDIKAVSELTGFKVGTIYNLIYKKVLPYYKPTGRKLLFRESEIIALFEKCRIKSADEE